MATDVNHTEDNGASAPRKVRGRAADVMAQDRRSPGLMAASFPAILQHDYVGLGHMNMILPNEVGVAMADVLNGNFERAMTRLTVRAGAARDPDLDRMHGLTPTDIKSVGHYFYHHDVPDANEWDPDLMIEPQLNMIHWLSDQVGQVVKYCLGLMTLDTLYHNMVKEGPAGATGPSSENSVYYNLYHAERDKWEDHVLALGLPVEGITSWTLGDAVQLFLDRFWPGARSAKGSLEGLSASPNALLTKLGFADGASKIGVGIIPADKEGNPRLLWPCVYVDTADLDPLDAGAEEFAAAAAFTTHITTQDEDEDGVQTAMWNGTLSPDSITFPASTRGHTRAYDAIVSNYNDNLKYGGSEGSPNLPSLDGQEIPVAPDFVPLALCSFEMFGSTDALAVMTAYNGNAFVLGMHSPISIINLVESLSHHFVGEGLDLINDQGRVLSWGDVDLGTEDPDHGIDRIVDRLNLQRYWNMGFNPRDIYNIGQSGPVEQMADPSDPVVVNGRSLPPPRGNQAPQTIEDAYWVQDQADAESRVFGTDADPDGWTIRQFMPDIRFTMPGYSGGIVFAHSTAAAAEVVGADPEVIADLDPQFLVRIFAAAESQVRKGEKMVILPGGVADESGVYASGTATAGRNVELLSELLSQWAGAQYDAGRHYMPHSDILTTTGAWSFEGGALYTISPELSSGSLALASYDYESGGRNAGVAFAAAASAFEPEVQAIGSPGSFINTRNMLDADVDEGDDAHALTQEASTFRTPTPVLNVRDNVLDLNKDFTMSDLIVTGPIFGFGAGTSVAALSCGGNEDLTGTSDGALIGATRVTPALSDETFWASLLQHSSTTWRLALTMPPGFDQWDAIEYKTIPRAGVNCNQLADVVGTLTAGNNFEIGMLKYWDMADLLAWDPLLQVLTSGVVTGSTLPAQLTIQVRYPSYSILNYAGNAVETPVGGGLQDTTSQWQDFANLACGLMTLDASGAYWADDANGVTAQTQFESNGFTTGDLETAVAAAAQGLEDAGSNMLASVFYARWEAGPITLPIDTTPSTGEGFPAGASSIWNATDLAGQSNHSGITPGSIAITGSGDSDWLVSYYVKSSGIVEHRSPNGQWLFEIGSDPTIVFPTEVAARIADRLTGISDPLNDNFTASEFLYPTWTHHACSYADMIIPNNSRIVHRPEAFLFDASCMQHTRMVKYPTVPNTSYGYFPYHGERDFFPWGQLAFNVEVPDEIPFDELTKNPFLRADVSQVRTTMINVLEPLRQAHPLLRRAFNISGFGYGKGAGAQPMSRDYIRNLQQGRLLGRIGAERVA